jgi:putative transposase
VLELISAILTTVQVFFRGRRDNALEILALRQQLAVFKRNHPRPNLRSLDRLFWTILRRIWPGWTEALIIVKPDTVVRWHRTGFRLYWRWRSRAGSGGRPKITAEIQALIRRMAEENRVWGPPKIHGELLKSVSTSRKGP